MNTQHPEEMLLHTYVDGELDPVTHAAIQTHIVTCDTCRQQVKALHVLYTALDTLPDVELTRDLVPGILDEIERSVVTAPALRWPILVPALLALSLCILAWPLIAESTIAWPNVSTLLEGSTLNLGQQWQTIEQQWLSLLESARQTFGQTQIWLAQRPDLPYSTTMLWILASSAALVWMLGNGLLLRSLHTKSGNGTLGH